ncbi:pituitary tumor-transforming gene 1 protein-interacting protein [Aplysia californica]|uniref:Pituitary tumor-transforming gene 1 protein-interacting protein n=1 Tax=Aplysia californica TaxID=6500 RepID=A0ABM0JW91_APLCA|nr:pituitary tumor-transforming gene 1 protein-interacting protein [Aplysia californica]
MGAFGTSTSVCILLLSLFVAQSVGLTNTTTKPTNSTPSTTGSTQTTAPASSSPSAQTSTPVTTTASTTPETPAQECAKHNGSCDDCVSDSKCMYCYTDNSCQLYPTGKVLPPSDMCALDEARWGVCWLNFEALIIAMSVIGGIIIIGITTICICCCCCRGRKKKRYQKEDDKYEQQKMERKMRQDERRTERKGKLDEIRRKYGLVKDP